MLRITANNKKTKLPENYERLLTKILNFYRLWYGKRLQTKITELLRTTTDKNNSITTEYYERQPTEITELLPKIITINQVDYST